MASKKKKKKHGGGDDELEEEALAEWLSRGLAMSDFTMAKMLQLWMEEDDGGGDDDDDDAEDALAAKQELIQSYSVLGPVVEHAKELASEFRQTAITEAKHLWATAKYYAEIPPLRRRRLLREHVRDVRAMDGETTKYLRIQQRVAMDFEDATNAHMELEFGLKKRNKGRAPLLTRMREMKSDADREQLARLRDDAEQTRQARIDQELAEKQRAEDVRTQHAADELVYKRQMNAKYWKKQLADAKAFAAQLVDASDASEQEDLASGATDRQHESAEHDTDLPRTVTTSSIGIFETSYARGEWHSATDGGHVVGLDEHTTAVATARNYMAEHELKRVELMEAQSRVAMLEEKLEQVAKVKTALVHDRRTLLLRKDAVVAEIKHLSDEHDDRSRTLAGPPRRDPSVDDKQQFHALVTRKAAQMKQLAELDARLRHLDRREQLAVRSEQALKPLLDAARASEATLQDSVDAIDEHRHDLPMVVGRSIFKPTDETSAADDDSSPTAAAVTALHTDPNALFAHVTMASKLELLKHAATPVREHFTVAKRLAAETWKRHELKALAQQELEVLKTRLADARDRVVAQQSASVRADLMHAITRYHHDGNKLRPCIFPLRGFVNWWEQRAVAKTRNVSYLGTCNRVLLEAPHVRGQLQGSVRFPKRGRFRLELSLQLQRLGSSVEAASERTQAEDSGDEASSLAVEDVQVFIGNDYDALQELTFRDPTGEVLRTGALSFEYFGHRLCYCVTFGLCHERAWQSPPSSQRHVALDAVGTYEERLEDFRDEAQRVLELQQRETHVVSELVKTMRLQSRQTSSERCTDLMRELLAVESSRAKTWDSTLLHGHEQRFSRVAYAAMLRLEIKKEVTRQIDDDVRSRQARGEPGTTADSATSGPSAVEASRMGFLLRKCALVEPQVAKATDALGDYCSFKRSPEALASSPMARRSGVLETLSAHRHESLVVGLRLEWRDGKSKVHVTHKLSTSASPLSPPSADASSGSLGQLAPTSDASTTVVDAWCDIESANAVYLASAFAKALALRRSDAAQARALAVRTDAQLADLARETQQTVLAEQDAVAREAREDALLQKQRAQDLAWRKRKLYADAIRLTTYNERVSAQIDFLVDRRVNALAQEPHGDSGDLADGPSASPTRDAIRCDVKASYAAQFVDGRLALANKTWERKAARIADKRETERRERAFRIRHEAKLADEIASANARDQAQLEAEHALRAKTQLVIPHFERAVEGQFACEHRVVKSWGTAYGSGERCKQCGKEMSASFDEPHHMRGADRELDMDVQVDRAHDAGGAALRVTSAAHRARVERERMRLEKEARAVQLSDAVLYDRMAPKVIDAFNYRHGLDRGVALDAAGSDELYARVERDAHYAAFQDNVLFHGRLRNFHVRIEQLNALHAHATTQLAVQRDFLANVALENAFVLEQLPLVERDHARAVQLLDDDAAALARLEQAKRVLTAAQKEREAARHAIEGVEEEAEFAEFHVPALVQSSDAMQAIVTRMQAEHAAVVDRIADANKQLADALAARAKTDGVLERLSFRSPGTLVQTPFGVARVLYLRQADACVVLTPLHWRSTFFFSVETLVAHEAVARDAACVAMAAEERATRAFDRMESERARRETQLLDCEDALVRTIVRWRQKKEEEEATVRRAVETQELALQLAYERSERKTLLQVAATEAKRLQDAPRVSLKRRTKASAVRVARPSRFDTMRVTRASEKRLAMASIEAALAGVDTSLRATFVRERDALYVEDLAACVLNELLAELTRAACQDAVADAQCASSALERALNTAIVPHDAAWTHVFTHTRLGFDRLWHARRTKCALLAQTWSREAAKLGLLQAEIARREELERLADEERTRLELRRREMLAEERRCRQFYVDEMVLYMQERKAMARAETEMREYVRLLALEAMKTKYAKMVEDRTHTSDKAARRLEIKLGKNEKHRLHREWLAIAHEDELATQIRERELAIAQAEALERQFDKYLIQQAIDSHVAAALEASRLRERVLEAQRLAAAKRAAFEAKLVQERMVATVTAFHSVAHAEVAWMDSVERAAYWLKQLAPLAATLQQLEPELARIVQEREHVVADARLKREHARKCQARLSLATAALLQAIQDEDACAKAYKKIHFVTATMDSEVLHGRPQRFRTTYLRARLHEQYFRLLTESIVRRAIVTCSEREVERLEHELARLHTERVVKSGEVRRLKRKHRRAFHMSLRRAELGKLVFGGSQRRLVRTMFQQWVKLWSQRVLVRASFELKHSLVLQQRRLEAPVAASAATATALARDAPTKLSILQDFQKRRQVCRLCKREYSETQNHAFACAYHPQPYELACVRSCPSRQAKASGSAPITASCMLHRAKRWLCCDETDEGRFGSSGCARRYHMPTRANPALAALVAKKTASETTLLEQIDQQLLELRERNVVGQLKGATKAVITQIERELADQRTLAAKYHTLDRR